MTFLCYESLVRSLPDCVKQVASTKALGPIIPLRMNLVMNHPNFPRLAYYTYLESRQSEITEASARQKEKWIRDIGCFEDNSFLEIIGATSSTRIRMFHYKLINRIITTNRYLKIIKVKDDDNCTFCKQEPETLAHMFWYCHRVQSFINSIKTYIAREYKIQLNVNTKTWFFPTKMSAVDTCIITLAKLVIYEARYKETQPNVIHLKNKLKWEAEI